jgi:hypothetical protein
MVLVSNSWQKQYKKLDATPNDAMPAALKCRTLDSSINAAA